jgi:hypothetical protein
MTPSADAYDTCATPCGRKLLFIQNLRGFRVRRTPRERGFGSDECLQRPCEHGTSSRARNDVLLLARMSIERRRDEL